MPTARQKKKNIYAENMRKYPDSIDGSYYQQTGLERANQSEIQRFYLSRAHTVVHAVKCRVAHCWAKKGECAIKKKKQMKDEMWGRKEHKY